MMDSMTMMIAAGTHRGVYSTNGYLIGVEPVITLSERARQDALNAVIRAAAEPTPDDFKCDCTHTVFAHETMNSRPQGKCRACDCKRYRNTLVDINEADNYYAELKARLDERAPA
jgi:hypothetical protein